MKIRFPIDPVTAKGMQAHIIHKGNMLVFDLSDFSNRQFKGHDAAEHLNAFWEKQTQELQDEIFDTYVKIHKVYQRTADIYSDKIYAVKEIVFELNPLCVKLLNLHKIEDVEMFVKLSDNIYIPQIQDSFVQEDNFLYSRDKTYIRSDYIDLVVATIILRAALPVAGEFLLQTAELIKQKPFRDMYCAHLTEGSEIRKHEACTKLDTYIRVNQPNDPQGAALLDLTSTDEYPDMMFSHIIIRKIMTGSLVEDKSRDDGRESHLVTIISNVIKAKLGGSNGAFFSNDNIKFVDKGQDQADDAPSIFELARSAMAHSVGDITIQKYYASNPHLVLENIDEKVDPALLDLFLDKINIVKTNPRYNVQEVQLKLCQYVVHKSIDARWLLNINYDELMNMFAVAQAVLWTWGYRQLAAILTATVPPASSQDYSQSTRLRIPQDIMLKLSIIYPFGTPVVDKKKPSRLSNMSGLALIPPVVEDIEFIEGKLSENSWSTSLPPDLPNNDIGSRVSVDVDIKIVLAKLAIDLHENFE